jgi:hypothetical protein
MTETLQSAAPEETASAWSRPERLPTFPICLALSCVAVILPLWVTRYLPAVDIPQHLFLIHVLSSLSDPASPYHAVYVAKPGFTYLLFYGTVLGLGKIIGIELAMKVYLSAVLAGFPLSLWALTRALGRSPWLSLLSIPLAFTDNFYWGLVSFNSSVPLCILAIAAFVRVLEQPEPLDKKPLIILGTSLLGVQLVHAAAMVLPGLAFVAMLALTPSDRRRRLRAISACAPAAIVFLVWVAIGLKVGRRVGAPGEPWTSAPGGLLSLVNYHFRPAQLAFDQAFSLLHGGFWGFADKPVAVAMLAAAAACAVFGIVRAPTVSGAIRRRARPLALFGIAVLLYFVLPSDVDGYMYQLAPRYAQIAALLLLPVLPFPTGQLQRVAMAACVGVAAYTPIVLAPLFSNFGREAQSIEPIIETVAPRSKIMHLVVTPGSAVATHAVYLHYAAYVAFRTDSIPSFSLAIDPSYPVGYVTGRRPPASPWEWQPMRVDFSAAVPYYDDFLWRGPGDPRGYMGQYGQELVPAAQSERWLLLKKR